MTNKFLLGFGAGWFRFEDVRVEGHKILGFRILGVLMVNRDKRTLG